MRALLLLLCLLAGEAWAETLYVCPTTVNTPTSAGSSPTTDCFDGTADVAWGAGAGSVSAGDTLCVVGNFVGSAENDVSGITLRVDTSGTDAATLVTVDGDCDGDGTKALFDGDNAVGIAIRTAIVGTSQTTYLLIKNIVMRQYTNKAVVTYNVTGDNTASAFQTWTGIEIYDHGDGGAGDNCFDSRGADIELSDSTISGCDEDGVYHQGARFRSERLTVSDLSRATSGGDGLQLAAYADNYYVSELDCTHNRDAKQCFIASVLTDTGASGVLKDSTLRCFSGATDQNCAFVTGSGARVERNFVTGGEWGIAVEGTATSVNMKIVGNVVLGATLDGIAVFGTAPSGIEILHNVSAYNGEKGIDIGPTNAMTIRNNVAFRNTDDGINRADAGQVEQYNDSFGNGGDAFALVGDSTSAGTGSLTSDPKFIGGTSPATAAGFKLRSDSPLRRTGLDLNIGNIQDHGNRAFLHPPSIGAWEATSRDEAAARTAR